MRRTRMAVLVVALVAAPGLSRAEEAAPPAIGTDGSAFAPVGECDGIAPVKTECSFRGKMPALSTAHLEADLEFTGRIGVRIVTSTGSYTASCDFFGIDEPICRSSTNGTLMIGQDFNAYGSASMASPLDGSEMKGVAAGRWRVSLTSP